MTQTTPNLSGDVCLSADHKTWMASICEHPPQGGKGVEVWRKIGMRTEANAASALDAEWKRRMGKTT